MSVEPKTRSYSGCFSCRAIKKKCLEDFDADGKCGRCVSRGVHCERTKPVRRPGGNPHGKRASGAHAHATANGHANGSTAKVRHARGATGYAAAGPGHSTTPPSLDDLSTVALSMAGKDGHHPYGAAAAAAAALPLPPYGPDIDPDPDNMQLPIPPPIPSTSAVPYSAPAPTATATAPATSSPSSTSAAATATLPLPLPLPLPCNPWDQMFGFLESDPSATLSVDPSLPHFDWAALTSNQPPTALEPSPADPGALPPLPPSGQRVPETPGSDISRHAALPTGMESILNGLATTRSSAGPPPGDSESPAAAVTPGSAAALEDDPLDEALTDDLAVIYNALNVEFLNLMPTRDRLRAAKAWTDLARSTRLGRTAAAACVWLYLARSSRTVDPEERSHLLAQSDRYFQRAVAQLSDEVSLDSQIYALLDLFFVQADRSSIHSGNALLAIGELFIKQAHGPRPPLDLVNHNSPSSLRMFAVLDILRCAVEKGRRTVFDIEGLPGSLRAAASAQIAAKVDADDNDWRLLQWSGFPLELILCIAATVNLDCDRAAMPPDAVNAVADKIEEAIHSWSPTRMQPNGYEDSLTFLQEVATKEMWRHATLLHFYRVIRQFGCLARPVQDSLYQLLHLGRFQRPPPPTKPLNPPPIEISKLWLRAFPWFMAATVATQPAERDLCRAGLRNYWSDSIVEENTKAAERMWSEMDRTGRDGDFREILQQGGLCAAFV